MICEGCIAVGMVYMVGLYKMHGWRFGRINCVRLEL